MFIFVNSLHHSVMVKNHSNFILHKSRCFQIQRIVSFILVIRCFRSGLCIGNVHLKIRLHKRRGLTLKRDCVMAIGGYIGTCFVNMKRAAFCTYTLSVIRV